MRLMTSIVVALAFTACRKDKDEDDTSVDSGGHSEVDADGDGWNASEDCDDDDPDVNPGASEICDGIDNDCDNEVDEGLTATWYADADEDGYGNPGVTTQACGQPGGYVDNAEDCDDSAGDVHPGAAERCDGQDNDCDGVIDEDVQEVWYADGDGDGYGNESETIEDCDPGEGYVAKAGDCDDTDMGVNPAATEKCNEVDDDCDGLVDDDDTDVAELDTWYADADGDGYGGDALTLEQCAQPEGYTAEALDCDDADAAVNPEAAEVCDGADNDCDALVDDDDDDVTDATAWYTDADGDGYGDPASLALYCEAPSTGVDNGDDCDDTDGAVSPAAAEACDGIDNDCDGDVDGSNAVNATTWYADTDADGYGDPLTTKVACYQPSGTVSDATDCDDTSAAAYPGADEYCDSIDNDCDGETDESDAVDAKTYYEDLDGDTYGNPDVSVQSCSFKTGYRRRAKDCDDTRADVNPGETEICDDANTDEDCDDAADDADSSVDLSTGSTWYTDGDGDGDGDPTAATTVACDQPAGYAGTDDDCDDADEAVNPGAEDICNAIDDDCDGTIDPDAEDTDGDGITNCLDPDVYFEDFNSGAWGDWSYVDLGGTNRPAWAMTIGYLYEASNAADSIAFGPDLGQMWTYTVTVDVYSAGGLNNGVGIAFGLEDEDNFWLARWLDPNDWYGTYTPPAQVDLYRCEAGSCSTLAADDGTMDLSVPIEVFTEMSVSVDGEDISVWLDGIEALTYTATGEAPMGAYYTGVWTWDNDGGVYYDDFEVTNR